MIKNIFNNVHIILSFVPLNKDDLFVTVFICFIYTHKHFVCLLRGRGGMFFNHWNVSNSLI